MADILPHSSKGWDLNGPNHLVIDKAGVLGKRQNINAYNTKNKIINKTWTKAYHFVKFIKQWNLARRNDGKTNSFLFTKKSNIHEVIKCTKISAVYSHSKTGAYGIIKFTMYIRLTAKKVISELLFIWCINSIKDTEMRTTQHRHLMICDFLNHQKVNKCHHNTQSLVTFCTQKWITSDSSHLLCFEAVHWHTHTHTHTPV